MWLQAVGIEHVPELVATSRKNIENDGKGNLLTNGNLILAKGDGRLGVPEHAPYDAIHVGAAAPSQKEITNPQTTIPHTFLFCAVPLSLSQL